MQDETLFFQIEEREKDYNRPYGDPFTRPSQSTG